METNNKDNKIKEFDYKGKKGKSVHYDCTHDHLDSTTESDFYPLTFKEITNLLIHAKQVRSFITRNSIQIRLCQAIPGSVCPDNTDNKIVYKQSQISKLYVNFVSDKFQESPKQLARKMYNIINI